MILSSFLSLSLLFFSSSTFPFFLLLLLSLNEYLTILLPLFYFTLELTRDERVDGQVDEQMHQATEKKHKEEERKTKNINQVDYSETTYSMRSGNDEQETVPHSGGVEVNRDQEHTQNTAEPWSMKLADSGSESHSPYLDVNTISTAHVDPDFALSYKPETVQVPDSPKLLSPVNIRVSFSSLFFYSLVSHSPV